MISVRDDQYTQRGRSTAPDEALGTDRADDEPAVPKALLGLDIIEIRKTLQPLSTDDRARIFRDASG